jgi:hypothetical protein
MSQTVQVDNSNYEFEVLLVKEPPSKESSSSVVSNDSIQSIPITKESIRYLEIEDCFTGIGLGGRIIISNFNSFLDQVGIFNVDDNNAGTNIFIRFKNLDFARPGVEAPEIFLLAALSKSDQISENEIDRNNVFEFEEYEIAKLKRTSTVLSNNTPQDITDAFADAASVQDIITKLLLLYNDKEKLKIVTDTTGTLLEQGDKDYLIAECIKEDLTLHDSIMILYDFLSYSDGSGFLANVIPGVIKLEQSQNTNEYEKVFQIKPLNQNILPLLTYIESQPSNPILSELLLESFVLQSSDYTSPSFSENIIERYSIERVDYNSVLGKKWVSIMYTIIDTCTSSIKIPYDDLKRAFGELFTGPYQDNLPLYEKPIFKKYSLPNLSSSLAIAYGVTKIFNSFVFDNVAITFRTKGNTYRKPDRFIEIKSEKKDINGYWFIISVKHIFTDSVYENEITCVKFYLDKLKESLPLMASASQTNTPPNQPAQGSSIPPGPVVFPEPLPLEEILDGGVLPARAGDTSSSILELLRQPIGNNSNTGPSRPGLLIENIPGLERLP